MGIILVMAVGIGAIYDTNITKNQTTQRNTCGCYITGDYLSY